jgi:hypothetical protein
VPAYLAAGSVTKRRVLKHRNKIGLTSVDFVSNVKFKHDHSGKKIFLTVFEKL